METIWAYLTLVPLGNGPNLPTIIIAKNKYICLNRDSSRVLACAELRLTLKTLEEHVHPGDIAASGPRSLPILPNVVAALDKARQACAIWHLSFVTPNLLLTLLELPDSEAAKCFDRTRPGLAEEWCELLLTYIDRALEGEFGDLPSFRMFDWDERPDVCRAKELAHMDGKPAVDELYLLLGVLDNQRSKTRRELAEYLGEKDYSRLRQITSERAVARDI